MSQMELESPSASAEVPPMKRPEHGKRGRKINVLTNHFEVTRISNFDEFVIYNIDIKPVNASDTLDAAVKRERSDYGKQIRRRIVKELGLVHGDWFEGVVVCYDGGPTIFCTDRLSFDRDTDSAPLATETIRLVDLQDLEGNATEYKVYLTRKDEVVRLTDLHKYINGEEFRWEFFDDNALKMFNALVHHTAANNFAQYGRGSIYDPGQRVRIDGAIELWTGWFATVRPGEGRLFVNVNPTYTCFYQTVRLDQFIRGFMEHRKIPPGKGAGTPIGESARSKVNWVLRGLLVRPIHTKGVVTQQRIAELSKTLGPDYVVKPSKGSDERIPLITYLRRNFTMLNLRYKHVVTLKITEGLDIAWPIELCEIVEGQRYNNNKLSARQRAEIISKSTMKPDRKMEETLKGAHDIYKLQSDPLVTAVGMEVSPHMAVVPARVLSPPQIQYNQNSRNRTVNPSGGSWNLRDVKFAEPGEDLKYWEVAVFEQERYMPMKDVQRFVMMLVDQCTRQGMRISHPKPFIAYYDTRGRLENVVKDVHAKAKQRLNNEPQLIFFILPDEKSPNNLNSDLYAAIKMVMDTQIGLLSQCVTCDKRSQFSKPQYCANLALKMNLKLGGVNSKLDENLLCLPSQHRDVLFLGADVTHFPQKNTPSICAVVGSLDRQGARFVTKYRGQPKTGQEQIAQIGTMIHEILEDYVSHLRRRDPPRSALPTSIIMYRDGVSESQYRSVLQFELREIQAACRAFREGYDPKITFAVVGKRHSTRLFPENPRDGDRNGNCPVGTVVDSDITHPTLNDFYMQSHYSLQGTARPSHFTVLYDENNLTVDDFQDLSNRLCYNFQRATRAVSIPSPTYYAHLTAYRARLYMKPPQGDELRELYPLHSRLRNHYPMYFV